MYISYFSPRFSRYISVDEAINLSPPEKCALLVEMAAENGHNVIWRSEDICDLQPTEGGVLPWYDAPVNDVLDYYFWQNDAADNIGFKAGAGLNLDKYGVAGIFEEPNGYVFLLHKKEGKAFAWCVSYAGGGRYFNDFNSAVTYCLYRFNPSLTSEEYADLMAAVSEHKRTGEPLKYPRSDS